MGIISQLRARRLALGLPLKILAYDLGVSEWWLCRLENGHGKVKPVILERWCGLLGMGWGIAKDAPESLRRTA
jgi:hypothetical protein